MSYAAISSANETILTCESLTNELILELFPYLTTSQIYHAFHGLNARFNALICEYFRTCRLNFQSISKQDFHFILQNHTRSMIHQITSLYLTDADDTPGQIDQFFSHGFALSQFLHLRSLCLDSIRSNTMMCKIMFQLPQLPNLTHLTFRQCHYPDSNVSQGDQGNLFANTLWSLPRLEYCSFLVDYKYRRTHHFVNDQRRDHSIFIEPSVTSSTLKALVIRGFAACEVSMEHLLQHTPAIQFLSIGGYVQRNLISVHPVQSMTSLSISCLHIHNPNMIINFFRSFPNLIRLKVDLCRTYAVITGDAWEDLISNHLVRLERLDLKMSVSMNSYQTEEEQVDRLLQSFRTRYWLETRRWYVQCDCNMDRDYGVLYTLPYAFEYYQILYPIRSKSTHPTESDPSWHRAVRHLMYKPGLSDLSSISLIQLSNIRHLSVQFPISDHFYSLVPTFDHLISLDAFSNNHDDCFQQQFKFLLGRASRLSSIRIGWKYLSTSWKQLFDCPHLSVYHLELIWFAGAFDREQCAALSDILSDLHCSVLSLNVADHRCILELVKAMHYLRALQIKYPKSQRRRHEKSISMATCVWLEGQLSGLLPNVSLSEKDDTIRLWLR